MICGFPAVGALSDTWAVANNSLPCAIKYFVQLPSLFYDGVPLSSQEVDMHKIKNSGPV